MRKVENKETIKEETECKVNVCTYSDVETMFNYRLTNTIYNWGSDDQEAVNIDYALGFDIEKNRKLLKELDKMIIYISPSKSIIRLKYCVDIGFVEDEVIIKGISKNHNGISIIHLVNGSNIHFIDMASIYFEENIRMYEFNYATVLGDFPVNTSILNSRINRKRKNNVESEVVKYSEGFSKEIQKVLKHFGWRFTGISHSSGLGIKESNTITFER